MSLRRVGGLGAVALATLLWMSCGEVFRPVVLPTTLTPPNPSNFHAVFAVNTNVPFNPGTAMQIDVSGDTDIGVANMGVNPTHAASLPNNSRVFVATAGSLYQGDADVVTSFIPASDSSIGTGLGAPVVFTLPNFGPIDPTTGKPQWTCSYLPDFVTTTQNTAVYVANYGVDNAASCNPNLASTDSVVALNASTDVVSNIAYLPAGSHPVALAETPNGQNLYVVNQTDSTVMDLSTADLTPVTAMPSTIAVGNAPVWAAVRPDGQRLYVVTQGDGQLYTINTATNALVQGSPQSVGGAGANFILYDNSLNRLYVTNPNAGAVYVFNATTDPPTPIGSATGVVNIPTPSPCATAGACSPVMPVSIAALPDGSRFYVASYATAIGACPDSTVSVSGCVIPQVTVFDAASLTLKTTVFPLLASVSGTSASGFALAPVAFCAPVVPYTPTNARFRMFAAAAADSSRVYASMCDGGTVAIINTTTSTLAVNGNAPDTLVTDLATPFSGAPAGANGQPPTQNPVFLLTGQ
jgi:DNA-binding beta-propeller fold protein YncE